MAEFLTSPDDILPACDQCHARKVKCNRRSPCANCADAGVECRRLRRGRSSRKQTSQRGFNPQETILDLDLETQSPQPQMNSPRTRRWRYQAGSLTQNAPTQSHSSDMDMADGNMDETADLEQPPQDHARNSGQTPLPVTAQPTSGANDSNYHAIQARNIIELELDDCQAIGRERQSILRSALQLVSSVAENEPGHSGSIPENPRSTDPAITIPEAPPRELLFMLLGGPLDAVRTQWPDHIPQKTYERMVTTLLQADQSDEFFPQHSVCIYVKAIFYLYQVTRTTDNPVLKRELSQSKSAYIAAAAQSIQRFNILQRPGLLTVQALLSSALLMQHIGRFNQCWLLTSYAARQITSLNYHKTCHALANSGLELEINCAVYWCYYLDRTLSSLLDRPPSLPEPVVSPTDLIVIESSSAYSGLLHIIIKLAQIQGKLHEISSCRESLPNSVMLTKCQPLEADMQTLLPYLESNRSSFSKMIQCDWVAVDFCYYAIFVEIHRIHLKSCFTPHIYRECLIHARKSLEAFYFLQQHSAEMPGFDDPYPSFLTWTLFLYPLSAFFVLFCHIVGTSDTSDFQLLRQITGGLLHFKQDPHLGRLLTLLQSLQRLCEPLFQKQSNNSATGEDSLANVNHSLAHFSGTGGPATESFTFPQSSPPALFRDDMPLVNEPIQNAELDPSAEWQMWQLFTNQAPNGWLNKGVDLFDL